jgi:hypothetical protein
MGEVHKLIVRHGIEAVRAMADSKSERQAIDAAALVMAEEESRLGITHAGFAMTSLPHKRIEDQLWRREGHKTTLLIESGRDRQGGLTGVPYGSIARLILLYLQTEATRTGNPEVELGRSMKSWMSRMNLTSGGKTYQLVTEQARRISACRLTFFTARESGAPAACQQRQSVLGKPLQNPEIPADIPKVLRLHRGRKSILPRVLRMV